MKLLTKFHSLYSHLVQSAEAQRQERTEAYLAGASDLYELESRMRQLDRQAGHRNSTWISSQG
jgi:hypothetical protein